MRANELSVLLLTSVLIGSNGLTAASNERSHEVTTRPAERNRKKGPTATMPADAKTVVDSFVKAVGDKNWEKALSYCGARTGGRAKLYGSEEYFQTFVPTAKLKAEPSYHFWTYSQDPVTGEYSWFGCFLNLSKTPDGFQVNWEWWLEKTAHGWKIELPDVPLDRWADAEVNRQRMLKEKSDARWKALEPKLEGLRTQLTALKGEHRVGQPTLFRLELINGGQHDLTYDSQQVDVNGSMNITDENGQAVKYIGGPVQTGGSFKTIRPGETVTLFDSLDVARQYDLSKPGTYRVQFSGRGLYVADSQGKAGARRGFPSNTIEIGLTPD